jgi:hypothetical protein
LNIIQIFHIIMLLEQDVCYFSLSPCHLSVTDNTNDVGIGIADDMIIMIQISYSLFYFYFVSEVEGQVQVKR